MVSELDTRLCASKDAKPPREWTVRFYIGSIPLVWFQTNLSSSKLYDQTNLFSSKLYDLS